MPSRGSSSARSCRTRSRSTSFIPLGSSAAIATSGLLFTTFITGRLGGTPETSGSTLGAIHRGWVNLKSAVTVSDKAIVSEVVNGETVAEKYFGDASKDQTLPQEALGLVQKQHAKIQESLNYAKDLYNKR